LDESDEILESEVLDNFFVVVGVCVGVGVSAVMTTLFVNKLVVIGDSSLS
jgi:hypothetical protein